MMPWVREAHQYGVPTTIFASVSDRTDVDIINHVLDDNDWPQNVNVRYMFQRGRRVSARLWPRGAAGDLQVPANAGIDADLNGWRYPVFEPNTLSRTLSFFYCPRMIWGR